MKDHLVVFVFFSIFGGTSCKPNILYDKFLIFEHKTYINFSMIESIIQQHDPVE